MAERNFHTLQNYVYQVYGLTIDSNIEIPYLRVLPTASTEEKPRGVVSLEVRWAEQAQPSEPGQLLLERGAGEIRVTYTDIGRTIFRGPRDVIFEAKPDATPEAVCQVLLSLTLPIAAALNGLTPIHASAVSTPEGAIVFLGKSGAGKSTTALALAHHTGWPMLADDVCAISARAGTVVPLVHSGPAVSRLWQNTVEKLGVDTFGYPLRRLSNGKLAFDLSQDWHRASADIKAFCYLSGDDGSAQSRNVKWIVQTLIDSIQVEPLLDSLGVIPDLTRTLIAAANQAQIVEITRRDIGDDLAPASIASAIQSQLALSKKGR
jgi:hypothetical protein